MIRIRQTPPETVRPLCDEVLLTEDLESVWRADGVYYGAFEDGQLVGFGGYTPSRRWADAVYLHASGVLPAARGKHLQRRLIRARLRHAKREGYVWAHTYTLPENPASSRSLIACGFKPYWPKNPWAGQSCYWHKKL